MDPRAGTVLPCLQREGRACRGRTLLSRNELRLSPR